MTAQTFETSRADERAVEAAEAILATLLAEPERLQDLDLEPDYFPLDLHRRVYRALRGLHDEGRPCNDFLLLQRYGNFTLDETAWMVDLCRQSMRGRNLSEYIQLLQDESIRRRCLAAAELMRRRADEGTPIADLGAETMAVTEALCQNSRLRLTHGLHVETATAIKTHRIAWLWPGVIPLGKPTTFSGDPGLGKSLVTLDIVARTTTGAAWPDGADNPLPPSDVLMLIGEDACSDTVVPRLAAAGADLSRVHFLRHAGTARRTFEFTSDISCLRAYLRAHPEIRLVIVDPLSTFLGSACLNREQQLRRLVFTPLTNLAEETGVAIVGVSHFSKTRGASAVHRTAGAVAMVGVPRMVWSFVKSPERDDRVFMLRAKGNLARNDGGMEYLIEERQLTIDGQPAAAPAICWMGRSTCTLNELLATASAKPGKIARAQHWLINFMLMNGGRVPTRYALQAATADGIAEATLRFTRERLPVKVEHPNGTGPWYWSYDATTQCHPEEDEAGPPDRAGFARDGVQVRRGTCFSPSLREGADEQQIPPSGRNDKAVASSASSASSAVERSGQPLDVGSSMDQWVNESMGQSSRSPGIVSSMPQ